MQFPGAGGVGAAACPPLGLLPGSKPQQEMKVDGDSVRNMVNLIRAAGQPEKKVADEAQEQLNKYDEFVGYKSVLLTIFSNREMDPDIRLVSAIVFKRSISRNWSPRSAIAPMKPEEKELIRNRLLELFAVEQDNKVAAQIAVIMASIARKDWPRSWHQLFPALDQAIQSKNPLHNFRGVEVLHQVLNVLASTQIHARHFQNAANDLISFSHKLWMLNMGALMERYKKLLDGSTPQNTNGIAHLTKLTNYCTQIMHNLVVYGVKNPAESEHVKEFYKSCLHALSNVADSIYPRVLRDESPLSAELEIELKEIVRYMCLSITKVQEKKPLLFSPYLPDMLKYFYNVVLVYKNGEGRMKFYVVQALTFLHNVVTCTPYSSGSQALSAISLGHSGIEFSPELQKSAQHILNAFFDEGRVRQLVECLIKSYFPLAQGDFDEWQNDPEQFFSDEQITEADEKIRASAKKLFQALVDMFRGIIAPFVVKMFQKALQFQPEKYPGEAPPTLPEKSAIFLAMGLKCRELQGELEKYPQLAMEKLFCDALVHWMKDESFDSDKRIIFRRRIIWTVGEYVDSFASPGRKLVFEALAVVLRSKDIVLRLTAVETLHNFVDTGRFHHSDFQPCEVEIIQRLFVLIDDLAEYDPQRRVITVLKHIIIMLRDHILPDTIQLILHHFPGIWEKCSTQNLLRHGIVECMTALVGTLRHESLRIQEFLIRILKVCTDNEDQETSYLTEYGFDFWYAVLENTPVLYEDLLLLFPNWVFHMKNYTSQLEVCMKIFGAYLLLGKETFVQRYGNDINQILYTQITSVREEGILVIAEQLDLFCQMFPQQTPTFLGKILEFMVSRLADFSRDRKTMMAPCFSSFINIFARIAFENTEGFIKFIDRISNARKQHFMIPLVKLWCDNYNLINLPYKQKLSTLALCNLLPTRNADLVKLLLPNLIEQVTSVAIRDQHADGVTSFPYLSASPNVQEWNETDRKMDLYEKDRSVPACVKTYFMEKLKECAQLNGQQNVEALWKQQDPLLMKHFDAAPKKAPPI